MEKFDNVLQSLESLKREFEIFVPSANKKIKFVGLTTKQQKDAVKCALDKNLSGISFANLANELILSNSKEKLDFLVIDRAYLLVSLRAVSLNKTFKNENEEIDLLSIVNNNISVPNDIKSIQIVDENVTVNASIPTLSKDLVVNNYIKKKAQPLADNDDLPKEIISEIYVNELGKFVDSVSIVSTNGPVDISFNQLTPEQRVSVIERLPLTVNNRLIEFINNVKSFEKKMFEVNGKYIDISIDPSLFTV